VYYIARVEPRPIRIAPDSTVFSRDLYQPLGT